MLEKDKNQRFDIIQIENEIKIINDSVVNRLYTSDASRSYNESPIKKLENKGFSLKQRYIVVKQIGMGSSTEVLLVTDTHDPTIKQLVNIIKTEFKLL